MGAFFLFLHFPASLIEWQKQKPKDKCKYKSQKQKKNENYRQKYRAANADMLLLIERYR